MVGLFLRLKWRLLVNGHRRSRAGRISTLFSVGFAVVLGGAGGLLTFGLASTTGAAWLPLVFTLVFGGWVVLPILAFGSDETLDPARLAMLPLGPRQLIPGLIAASSLSVGGLATLLVVAGPVLATRVPRGPLSPPGANGGLVVLAGLLLLIMSVTASRVATTALSTLLRSRRGRDAIATLSMVVGLSFYGLSQFPATFGDRVQGVSGPGSGGRATWDVLQWTPPGQAGLAAVRGLQGDVAYALLHLQAAALATLVLAGLWWLALRRLQETPGSSAASSRTRLGLLPRPLRLLPAGRTTAVMSRELRHLGRHAGRRVRALQQATFLFFPLFSLFSASDADPRLVLFAGGVEILAINEAALQFGSDGPALWAHVATGGSWRPDVFGRNLALFLVQLALGVVVILLTAALTDGWQFAMTALLLIPVSSMLGLSVGNVIAIRFPFPVPDMTKGNVFGQARNQKPGCLFTLASMVGLLVIGVIAALHAGMLWQRADDAVFTVAAVLVGWCVSGAIWLASVRVTADEAERRGPELLEAISPR